MLATVTSKGQVTIPKAIRDMLRINTNDKIDFIVEGGKVLLSPVKTLLDLRGAVPSRGKGDISHERATAKDFVARRVAEEMEETK